LQQPPLPPHAHLQAASHLQSGGQHGQPQAWVVGDSSDAHMINEENTLNMVLFL